MSIDQRIMRAYLDLSWEERAQAGVHLCSRWEEAVLSDEPIEEYMVRELRASGRLPEGWPDA